jgi:hypothetical protein
MGYKCKTCGKEYKSNISGSCVKHVKSHNIEFIDLNTHYDEVEIKEEPKMSCPICGKEYKNNLGGAITNHIVKEHALNKDDVKDKFPQLFVGKDVYDYGTEDRTCIVCGKIYKHRIHKDKSTKKTCSKECANKLISIVKTKKIKSVCEICGNEFEHKKSKSPRFCSIQCKAKSQEGRQEYKIELDTNKIRRMYLEGLSCEVIGKKMGYGKKLIRSRLIDMGVELRDGYYSSVEDEIIEWLNSIGIKNIDKNNKTILNGKELDIYLPDYKLAIEYNGLYWHSESKGRDRKYHLNKTEECEDQGIQLLHIFEDEWYDKEDIVKNIIKTKLGISNKLYARKCVVKELKSNECKTFLEENHIQGYIAAKVNLGLFYENELVSLLTLRQSRFNSKYDWEIARYVNKAGYSITGGFARLLKHFKDNYSGSIITYSDRRLFDGSIYENNGFNKLKPSSPNYYYTKSLDRQTRQNFQKHKLKDKLEVFNPDLTEYENMQLKKQYGRGSCNCFKEA